ncbi:type IV pilus assembly protein FimV [Pseudomonas sp. NPDC089569]|uniref:type IV pilus assembly protein FimV n=1 Tax=Pseudomonas sp. NPDC089569 TaxID=3390722 RepID=UPI003CFD3EB6
MAPALGLGEITLHSALNQPLRADIALVDSAGLAEGELSVSLATADEFNRAGVERVFFLNNLKFTPVVRDNRSVIQVTSSKPVNEPFLNFLVQLNQPNGRLLREYTVLIDPPGTAGIVPASDEPPVSRPSSPLADVQPVVASPPAPNEQSPQPTGSPEMEPAAEQLAASSLQNQRLQATIDELNAKVQAQDEQIAAANKQVAELQTRLAEAGQASAQAPASLAPNPMSVVVEEGATRELWIGGGLALVVVVLLALRVRSRRQQDRASFEPLTNELPGQSTELPTHAIVVQPLPAHPEKMSAASSMTVPPEPIPAEQFHLNLDELSMDTRRDPSAVGSPTVELPSRVAKLSEPQIEWSLEPVAQTIDDSFVDAMRKPGSLRELEPHPLPQELHRS